jgi:hypothetical protein
MKSGKFICMRCKTEWPEGEMPCPGCGQNNMIVWNGHRIEGSRVSVGRTEMTTIKNQIKLLMKSDKEFDLTPKDLKYEMKEYADDIKDIQEVSYSLFEEKIGKFEAAVLWSYYSASVCASWLIPDEQHIMSAIEYMLRIEFKKGKKK